MFLTIIFLRALSQLLVQKPCKNFFFILIGILGTPFFFFPSDTWHNLLSSFHLYFVFKPNWFRMYQECVQKLFCTRQLVSFCDEDISFLYFHILDFRFTWTDFVLHQSRLYGECLKSYPCPKGNNISLRIKIWLTYRLSSYPTGVAYSIRKYVL